MTYTSYLEFGNRLPGLMLRGAVMLCTASQVKAQDRHHTVVAADAVKLQKPASLPQSLAA
jgi:hypothetical protein